MIQRVFKRLGLAKDFNVPFLMITNESTISSIFGMWAIALEYIDKSSCSAHPVPLHHADNENSAFHDTVCGFLDSFFAIEKTSAGFSGPEPVSSLPITRKKDSKIHSKAMEQKNRQIRTMSCVNELESELGEFEGFK